MSWRPVGGYSDAVRAAAGIFAVAALEDRGPRAPAPLDTSEESGPTLAARHLDTALALTVRDVTLRLAQQDHASAGLALAGTSELVIAWGHPQERRAAGQLLRRVATQTAPGGREVHDLAQWLCTSNHPGPCTGHLAHDLCRLHSQPSLVKTVRSAAARALTITHPEGLITAAQATAIAQVAPSTWAGYVAHRQAPQPLVQDGGTPLWDAAAVVEWWRHRTKRQTHKERARKCP